MALTAYLLTYLVGGLTFIPCLIAVILCHAYFTQPVVDIDALTDRDPLSLTSSERASSAKALEKLPPGSNLRTHDDAEEERGVASFVVCREYAPAVLLGKPAVDRPTKNSTFGPAASPSVYQTMYRTIFERGKNQTPSLDPTNKNSRNEFYIVIRLGTLMLYDHKDNPDVRHVISLSFYDVDIYGGNDQLSEGELFVKRNCLRLRPKTQAGDENLAQAKKPFYLFTADCSKKEDFYHTILEHQLRDGQKVPKPLACEDADLEKLNRDLNASKAHLETKWLNALIGRIFLSIYKTSALEDLVQQKIDKKLSRVAKPAFITALEIRSIDLGTGPPLITNPVMKSLHPITGDLVIGADVRYKGSARVDVAAVARLDFGPRFKVRQVQILLAVMCKSLDGSLLVHVKPPPSNRIWFSFAHEPTMDLSIEPVVSSRQITYGIILRQIESRLREVIAETLVIPNWDDIPFADSADTQFRGGLWEHHSAAANRIKLDDAVPTLIHSLEEDIAMGASEKLFADDTDELSVTLEREKKKKRSNLTKTTSSVLLPFSSSSSSNAELIGSTTPKVLRSTSFTTTASPVLSRDQALMTTPSDSSLRPLSQDAASSMKVLSQRSSQPSTPTDSPNASPAPSLTRKKVNAGSEERRAIIEPSLRKNSDSQNSLPLSNGHGSKLSVDSLLNGQTSSKRQTFASATATMKKWGLELVRGHSQHSPSASVSSLGNSQQKSVENVNQDTSSHSTDSTQNPGPSMANSSPIGRGRPFPPLGEPLPGPVKSNKTTWAGSLLGGRKPSEPLNGATSFENTTTSSANQSLDGAMGETGPPPPPPLPMRPSRPGPPQSPSLEDVAKGSLIPRPIPKPPSRRRKSLSQSMPRNESGANDDDDDDTSAVLVLKAPETGNETEPESEQEGIGDKTAGKKKPQEILTPSFHDDSSKANDKQPDLEDEPDSIPDATPASLPCPSPSSPSPTSSSSSSTTSESKKSRRSRALKPPLKTTLSSSSASRESLASPLLSPSIQSAIGNNDVAVAVAAPLTVSKWKSRQSLIPTLARLSSLASLSQKGSPTEEAG